MGKGNEVAEAIIGIIAAIFLGLLGAAIIDALTKPKCPNCGNLVNRNAPYCEKCHMALRWY